MKLNTAGIIGLAAGFGGALVGVIVAFTVDMLTGIIVGGAMLMSFSILYFVFLKPALEYSRLAKNGISGIGTILSVSETNTRINDQPLCKVELKIEIPGRPSYTVITKTVISYFHISKYQPGCEVEIKADPNNPQKVIILREGDQGGGGVLANATPEQIKELQQSLEDLQKEHDSIRAVGIYSKAIVTKYIPSGIHVNGKNPFVTLELQILPDNEPAFSATTKGAIKESSVPLYQPGEEIFVKYDPNDKTRVVIEHS